jgi:membrane associated rhomboid family serine protease
MMSPYRIGPEFTPTAVKKLLILTLCFSLGSAFLNPFFSELMHIPGPQEWFSLSWWGMDRYLLWQPLSYLFIHPIARGGIGFSYFISLIFHLYILWVMGSDICQKVSEKAFTRLYLTTGVTSGLITLFLMPLIGQYAVLAGPTASIIGLLICWAFLHPEQELLLFFLFPVKAKWLALGITGIAMLLSVSNLQFIYFFLYLPGALIGYLYALVGWGVHSPFPTLYKPEWALIRFSQKLKSFLPKGKNPSKKGKIVSIKTGEPDDDEAFVDAMLEKISRYGEGSLTFSERKRMKSISERKSNNS